MKGAVLALLVLGVSLATAVLSDDVVRSIFTTSSELLHCPGPHFLFFLKFVKMI